MSIWILMIVAGGIAIFYFFGFLPEIKKWYRRKKRVGDEHEVDIEPQGKVKLSIFGITLRRK